jgi:hypothetical protein
VPRAGSRRHADKPEKRFVTAATGRVKAHDRALV